MSLKPENDPNPSQKPIGDRELTQFEQWDAMICGLLPEDVRDITAQELAYLADMTADLDGLHLGS